MKDKILLHCVFHEEYSPSLIVEQNNESFECLSCGKKGLIKDEEKVGLAILRHIFGNDNVFFGKFREILTIRCSDAYPLQIVLNSGVIIEVDEMSRISFYEDHIQLYDNTHTHVKIIYPHNKSEFLFRHLWIPYDSISFVTDAAS